MVPEPIAPCHCVERTIATREELLLKDGEFVRVKIQFECCDCGKYAAIKILNGEEKP